MLPCIDQPTMPREYSSSTAAAYSQPSAVQMYVKSVTHFRLGAPGRLEALVPADLRKIGLTDGARARSKTLVQACGSYTICTTTLPLARPLST